MLVFVDNFQKIANIFKCDTSSSLSLLSCLRKQEAEHIILNSKVGETSWQQNFLMAHLQNFSTVSDQSSLMVHSKVDFSYLLLKYSVNVEITSHVVCLWKFQQCHSTCEVVSKVWTCLCFMPEAAQDQEPIAFLCTLTQPGLHFILLCQTAFMVQWL